jgi:hypothetical protein
MHVSSLSGHWIKPTSNARLRISWSAFALPWINDMEFGGGASPAGLGEAGRLGFVPIFPKKFSTCSCIHNSTKTCNTLLE